MDTTKPARPPKPSGASGLFALLRQRLSRLPGQGGLSGSARLTVVVALLPITVLVISPDDSMVERVVFCAAMLLWALLYRFLLSRTVAKPRAMPKSVLGAKLHRALNYEPQQAPTWAQVVGLLGMWLLAVGFTASFSDEFSNAYLAFVIAVQVVFAVQGPRYGAIMLGLATVAESYHLLGTSDIFEVSDLFALVVLSMVGVISWSFVSAANKARNELQQSQERYRLVVEGASEGIFLLDLETRHIIEANASFEKLLGYSAGELVGRSIYDLSAEAPENIDSTIADIVAGEHTDLGVQQRRKDGSLVDIEANANLVTGSGRDIMFAVVRDITERKRAEEARRDKETSDRANRAKSEFLSRMSHELRTPLNAILGFGQLLAMDSTTPEQEESVEYILSAGRHLLVLVNEVLDIARIEDGKIEFTLDSVSVRDVVQGSLDLVRTLAANRNIVLNADLDSLDACYVMADRQRLHQVLLNLVANAIKYNREGGKVTVSCNSSICEADDLNLQDPQQLASVRIAVCDTGYGFAPDKMARLFTAFDRLGAEQGDVEGTGLGLALSKHLVEAMGGAIGVESEQDKGSTFWIELPAAAAEMPSLEHILTTPLPATLVSEHLSTVLYIEDNLPNLLLVERLLARKSNITLITSIQGQMGLDMAQEHSPDLILLDLHLPDMSGEEVLRRLREDPRTASIPVVMLTADANPHQIDKLLEAGAQTYLTKPLDVKQFFQVLEETVGQEQKILLHT